jgi:hypothetical protein
MKRHISDNVRDSDVTHRLRATARTIMECPCCKNACVEFQEAEGQTVCMSCGTVLEEDKIVSSVEFQETGDRSTVIGQYINASSSKVIVCDLCMHVSQYCVRRCVYPFLHALGRIVFHACRSVHTCMCVCMIINTQICTVAGMKSLCSSI